MLWNVDTFSEMDRLRREMNRLFSNNSQSDGAMTYPLVNIYDDPDNLIVTAELPGLSKEQVNITFTDGMLTISGKQEMSPKLKEMAVVRKERSEGEFEKSLKIPTKIIHDKINASFSNGILTVTLPKAEEAKPKSIAIEVK